MKQCPFFGKCGGCKYDFASADYVAQKSAELSGLPMTEAPVWCAPGMRRRADLCFADGRFGLFAPRSKDIVPVRECPNLTPEINGILPALGVMPWAGAGSCLITLCDNGLDIAITSNVPYCTPEFRTAAARLPAIRITWNGRVIRQTAQPVVKFDDVAVDFPSGAFLQPSVASERAMRELVVNAAAGASRVADLFCGLGNFTYALNADGFDVAGTGVRRDLFTHPLTLGMLRQYDCVVMDPPRAGAMAQCTVLAKSDVRRVIYVSCNPATFRRDMDILTRGGYKLVRLTPVDQFVGSSHWELVAVFDKK